MNIRAWFVRTLVTGQVRACTGEVAIYLRDADPVERASILLIAQMYRHNGFELEPRIAQPIDNPNGVSPVEAGTVFAMFRDSIFQSKGEIEAIRRDFAGIGVPIPDWQERQFKRTRMALQVWMATVGIRLVESTQPKVRFIWTMLHDSLSSLPAALSTLRDFERNVNERVAPGATAFSTIDEREARVFCAYVPKIGVASS